jgi:hypothetical protein
MRLSILENKMKEKKIAEKNIYANRSRSKPIQTYKEVKSLD